MSNINNFKKIPIEKYPLIAASQLFISSKRKHCVLLFLLILMVLLDPLEYKFRVLYDFFLLPEMQSINIQKSRGWLKCI